MNKLTLLSREQENKKVFFQLGKKFNLPLDIIIYLYNSLRKSIYYDRSLQINFHINILSSRLCEPLSLCIDIDDKFVNIKNPFQYRIPIGRGNEWLIYSQKRKRDYLINQGLYNELSPMDIILQQIKIYGELNFIKKYTITNGNETLKIMQGMERIRFINNQSFDLFNEYISYLDFYGYNIVAYYDDYEQVWFDDIE